MSRSNFTWRVRYHLNATFNNISGIFWRSVLLVQETGDPDKTIDLSQVKYRVHLACAGFELTTLILMVIGTDCIFSFKSNYHTITTTVAPNILLLFNKIKKIPDCSIYHIRTVPKCNWKIVEMAKSITLTHTYIWPLIFLVQLFLWNFFLLKIF